MSQTTPHDLDDVFLDTSIHIVRTVKHARLADRADSFLAGFRSRGTSTYCLLEFRRRVLEECEYLLGQFRKLKSFTEVDAHIKDVLGGGGWWHRKRNICLDLMRVTFPSATEDELAERTQRTLRTLLKNGLEHILTRPPSVEHLEDGVGCRWSRQGARRRSNGRLRLDPIICKSDGNSCRIPQLFKDNASLLASIAKEIDKLPDEAKTQELRSFSCVIRQAQQDPSVLRTPKVCRKLGDLLIALDSKGFQSFYTQNAKESVVLCRILRQRLFVRPNSWEKEECRHDFGGPH